MTGTEKQIKWANDIIKKLNDKIDALIRNYKRLEENGEGFGFAVVGYTDAEMEKIKADCNAAFERMSSSQIIDGRHRFGDTDRLEHMARMLYKETH